VPALALAARASCAPPRTSGVPAGPRAGTSSYGEGNVMTAHWRARPGCTWPRPGCPSRVNWQPLLARALLRRRAGAYPVSPLRQGRIRPVGNGHPAAAGRGRIHRRIYRPGLSRPQRLGGLGRLGQLAITGPAAQGRDAGQGVGSWASRPPRMRALRSAAICRWHVRPRLLARCSQADWRTMARALPTTLFPGQPGHNKAPWTIRQDHPGESLYVSGWSSSHDIDGTSDDRHRSTKPRSKRVKPQVGRVGLEPTTGGL
jgi:hypothetical protein